MTYTRPGLIIAAAIISYAATPGAAQRGELRARVLASGSITRLTICCGPTIGLKETLEYTQLTVEGSVSVAETGLHEGERSEYVYTDYVVDVRRTFRLPPYPSTRATPGTAVPWPFVTDRRGTRGRVTLPRLRLRVPNQGTVRVAGGSITDQSSFPSLTVGQRVIVSAYFCRDVGAWVPLAVFEVRSDRVVPLHSRMEGTEYGSVDEFAAALEAAIKLASRSPRG
jgi:hypothetical protein